ncbi:hypothetical protein H8S90_23990 [Olivibacter sp. SDN3]|uniref:hypothetical protein n=1 Tax=Olivibacter sp. SDN3 TaxID=2764720 RepID=UPI00165162D4|nr:hypothetical protein [Olivibacter sp. SDN3]QNL49733.1 hypothetical protein H8S90_23990 [Olivibacter sp. SDN3]
MLQKSLAHTNYIDIYQQFKDEFLVNDTCKWFVDKRNEVLKQQPFDLEKKVIITVYTGKTSLALVEKIFTVENDIEFSTIIDSLRIFLVNINPIEVFFSAEFSFYEKGQSMELYESLISGINHMKLFVTAVKSAINEECTLCDQLEQKINSMNFYRVPKNMLFVDDYVYNCQKDLFEKGSRIELTLESPPQRVPIDRLSNMASNGKEKDPFYNFVLMHIVLFKMQKNLMPTCMIVYNDDTFEFKSFDSSIKMIAL